MHVAKDPLMVGLSNLKSLTFFVMSFEKLLKGGHPNSLGNTLEVVDVVLGNTDKLEDLFLCYQADDETVRLRTSNCFQENLQSKTGIF